LALSVFVIVLFAAALHATWNALVKGAGDKLLTTVLVAASASLIAAVVLPFLPQPAPASWPFIATSTVLQVGYFVLVARAYHAADMSQTYPLMRGTAPLLVALASTTWIGEPLSSAGWIGVAVICAGILSMMGGLPGRDSRAGVMLALMNAVVIAGYTLVDGVGVRLSGSPAAYTLWLSLLTGPPLLLWALLTRSKVFRRYTVGNWHLGLIGGIGTLSSYGIALWAMTLAPVAVVAALRETSILFGAAISALVLKERVGGTRIAAALIIAAGAMILRMR